MDHAKPPQADILESISGTAPELLDCLLLIRYLALDAAQHPDAARLWRAIETEARKTDSGGAVPPAAAPCCRLDRSDPRPSSRTFPRIARPLLRVGSESGPQPGYRAFRGCKTDGAFQPAGQPISAPCSQSCFPRERKRSARSSAGRSISTSFIRSTASANEPAYDGSDCIKKHPARIFWPGAF